MHDAAIAPEHDDILPPEAELLIGSNSIPRIVPTSEPWLLKNTKENDDDPTLPWQARRACNENPVDMIYLFFGPAYERREVREDRERKAKNICKVCVVRSECLNYALENRIEHGIWGGLDESERRIMRSKSSE